MKKTLFVLAGGGVLLAAASLQAQVDFSAGTYTQTFDTALGTATKAWVDNSTVTGWYVAAVTGTTSGPTSATAFSGNMTASGGGSTSTTAIFNYGVAGTNPLTDRALGGSGATTAWSYFGLQLVNDTASPITSVAITYDGEQWRKDAAPNTPLTVSYQIFAPGAGSVTTLTGWTADTDLTYNPSVSASSGSAIDGNAPANRAAGITSTINIDLPVGDELWIRWSDEKISGNNIAQGIDNVVVTPNPTPEPSTYALLGLGLAVMGCRWRIQRARMS